MTLTWIRLTLPLAAALLPACAPTPDEVETTTTAGSTGSTSDGPGPSTTPSTTTPGEDTVGTQGVTSNDTTMGAVDTGTSTGVDETTMSVDPTTSSNESSSSGPPPPECTMPSECPNNETCDGGQCVSVCNAWGAGDYGYCLTPLGGFDSAVLCGEPLTCINAGDPIEVVVCGRSCATQCDCPEPPATGNAIVTCGDLTGDADSECHLSCANGETCPDDMTCRPDQMGNPLFCAHPVQPLEMYGNCDDIAASCNGGSCGISGTASVCTEGCSGPGDCEAAPAGGMAPDCDDVFDPPGGNDCFLPCNFNLGDCPVGMVCVDVSGSGGACMW